MLRRVVRHMMRRVRPGSALPPPVPRKAIARNAAATLAQAGAIRLATALAPPVEDQPSPGRRRVCFAIPATTPEDTALLAVTVALVVQGGAVTLRLVQADGTAADTLSCAPADGCVLVTLFAPPAPGLMLELEAPHPEARFSTSAVAAWCLTAAALDPARLMPQVRLAADPTWARAYGHPGAQDTAGRLRERGFAMMAAPALVRVLDGLPVWLVPGDELSRALLLSGSYEPETLLAIQALLPPGGVFVDVGAHCGLISAFAARRVGPTGRVVSFEPSPREFARLQANLAAGDFTWVIAHQAAIADTEGEVTLRLAEPGHAGHNTIGSAFAYEGVAVAELAQVRATTLDAALAGLDRCELIKLDIEGAELRALRGGAAALARLRPALILEVFDRALAGSGDTVAGLMAWLAANGYQARDIDPATGRFDAPAHVAAGESKNIVALPK